MNKMSLVTKFINRCQDMSFANWFPIRPIGILQSEINWFQPIGFQFILVVYTIYDTAPPLFFIKKMFLRG